MWERQRIQKEQKRAPNPRDPVAEPAGVTVDPTNVHVLFLQQELYFESWWALLADKKPMGLAQRCLFNFGVEMTTSQPKWTGFFKEVSLPLLEDYFAVFVQRLGPQLSAKRKEILLDVEELGKLYARKPSVGTTLWQA